MDIEFHHHPRCIDELEKYLRKHCGSKTALDDTIEKNQVLLYETLVKKNPLIGPKHLGRAEGFGAYEVYWLKMAILSAGLSYKQFPKVYILKLDGVISFLCIDSHITNYQDAILRKLAKSRIEEILEVIANAC